MFKKFMNKIKIHSSPKPKHYFWEQYNNVEMLYEEIEYKAIKLIEEENLKSK